MKPQIRACAKGWILIYQHPPGSLKLFGLNVWGPTVYRQCVHHEPFDTHSEAVARLRTLYKSGQGLNEFSR